MTTKPEEISPPAADEYNEYYHRYISLAPATDFISHFQNQIQLLRELLGDLQPGTDTTLHSTYTWTLKQVVGHLIDCERIFSTRLLRIGVGDAAEIPGIDQDVYVANLDYTQVSMDDLLDEFANLRQANVLLAKRMSMECLDRRGVASGNPVTAKANLFILAGHVEYHVAIMKQRLGITQ